MMKWGKCIFLLGMLFVLSLSGCTKQPEQGNGVVDTAVKTEVNWEKGFMVGEVKQVQEWNTCDFQKISQTHIGKGEYKGGKALTNSLNEYVEIATYKENEDYNYYIKRISPEGKELSETFIDKSSWETEENVMFAYDVVGEQMYFGVTEQGNTESTFCLPVHVYVMITDKEGKLSEKVDLSAGLAALGCNEVPSSFYVDGEGYIYVLTQDDKQRSALYVTDSAGNSVLSYLCDTPYKDIIFSPVRDNFGQMFIPIYELADDATILLWRDSHNQWKELARLEGKIISTWFGMENNLVFYQDGYDLVRWDVINGNAEELLNLSEKGFEDAGQILFSGNGEGQVYLRSFSKEKDWVVRLTSEALPYIEPVTIGMRKEMGVSTTVASAAVTYSREYSVPVEIQDDSNKDGESRLLMEMVNGQGPDIMYVSYEDMIKLQSKDALLDLSDILPESVKETFLPQAIELGTLEGILYGIPVGMNLYTMFANTELWSENGWTMEDIFYLTDSTPGLECLFTEQYDLLAYLLMYDLMQGKSKFIDWEQGFSRFEEMDFMGTLDKLLSYAVQGYFNTESLGEEAEDKVISGVTLGYVAQDCDPFWFNSLMISFDEKCHAVGFPAEDRQGHYLEAEGLLVVNANVNEDKKEQVRNLLIYMVGEEVQKKITHYALSIIDGLVNDNVYYDEETEEYYYKENEGVQHKIIPDKDGKIYLDEYRELIAKATPLKGDMNLVNILLEELQAFFTGDRSALEVTRKIDNRVQLYLDEQGSAR